MDAKMPAPPQAAVVSFLLQLPRAANRLEADDIPWLLNQLSDGELREHLSTKMASSIARNMGSSGLQSAAELLPRVATAIAVHWERDDLIEASDIHDKELAVWLATLADDEKALHEGSHETQDQQFCNVRFTSLLPCIPPVSLAGNNLRFLFHRRYRLLAPSVVNSNSHNGRRCSGTCPTSTWAKQCRITPTGPFRTIVCSCSSMAR